MINNNGATISHRRDKTIQNVKMPLIENMTQITQQVSTYYAHHNGIYQ